MTIKIWKFLVFFALASLITSCATVAPPAPEVVKPWKEREPALNKVDSWTIKGKIAVQTPRDAGSATVDWVQANNNYKISLMGPMGSNGISLNGRPGQVTLKTADGKSYSASSGEELLAKRWGFHLPVSNMRYWIRGMPVPGANPNTRFDSFGRVSQLSQNGWTVQYLSYTKSGGVDLPSRIAITSPSMKVKIVIYQWSL